MDIMDKLQAVEDKFLELESLISDPSILEDMNRWQRCISGIQEGMSGD